MQAPFHKNVSGARAMRVFDQQLRFSIVAMVIAAAFVPRAAFAAGICSTVVSSTNDDGAGSLRQALACASAGGVVTFDSSFNVPRTIVLSTGELVVDKSLTVSGPGAQNLFVDGNGASRVFSITTSSAVTMSNLTVQNGSAVNGGGIYNVGSLTLNRFVISGSVASAAGGGLYSAGPVTFTEYVTVTANLANLGGGAYISSSLSMTTSAILSNTAQGGGAHSGGLYVGGSLNADRSELRANWSTGDDGGAKVVGAANLVETQIVSNTAELYNGGLNARGALSMYGGQVRENVAAVEAGGARVIGFAAITNTQFLSNVVRYTNAGGLYGNAGGVLRDVVFEGNYGNAYGGGLYANGGAWEITGGRFVSNTALAPYGGGLYFKNGTSGALHGVELRRNVSRSGNGGGMYADNAALTLDGVTFIENAAPMGNGGGLGSWGALTVTNGITMIGNVAANGGGSNTVAPLIVEGGYFANNVGTSQYGAIYSNGAVVLSGTQLISNSSTGAAAIRANSVILTNTTVLSNVSTSSYANIEIDGDALVAGSLFRGNQAMFASGIHAMNVTVVDSQLISNTTSAMGGVMQANVTLDIRDSLVQSNTTLSQDGGGVYAFGAVIAENVRFESNSAGGFGGGFLSFGSAVLTDVEIFSNTAGASGGGGYVMTTLSMSGGSVQANRAMTAAGIYVGTGAVISDVLFRGNVATGHGGGVLVVTGTASVANSRFTGNQALSGAALSFLGTGPAVATVTSSTIDGNSASSYGALSSISRLVLVNSTLYDNRSSIGVLALVGAALISNTTVYSTSGSAVAIAGVGPYHFSNSVLVGTTASVCYPSGSAAVVGAGNFASDASCGFPVPSAFGLSSFGTHGGALPTLALLPGSPLIDAGQVACPAADQRGVARTGACDVGAFESSGFTITVRSGGNQTTTVNAAFEPMVLELSGAAGEPMGPGGIVSFTYSDGGAGLASSKPATATTDASGVVTLTLSANVITGTHVVTASARGAIGETPIRLVNVGPVLNIYLAGNGSGVVNGVASGTACSAACSAEFGYGDVVSLTAAPAADARFTGWSGDCSGTGVCLATMTRTHHVTATFAANRDDAALAALTLSAGALTPAFVSTTTAYAAQVPAAVSSVILTPTLHDAAATFAVASSLGACPGSECALQSGVNVLTVTVTASNNTTVRTYVISITRLTPTATATRTPAATTTATRTPAATATATRTPTSAPASTATRTPTSAPASTATPAPTSTPAWFAPYVSPNYGPAGLTTTVYIIGPVGSGFSDATMVIADGRRMYHVVINDRRVVFTMKATNCACTTDVVLVRPGGNLTFTQSYTFEAPTVIVLNPAVGGVLTTTSGVTVAVPAQAAARPDSAEVQSTLAITYAAVDQPAPPPGDVPLSFFAVNVSIDGTSVPTLTNAAVLDLPVDASRVPFGQRARLYEYASGVWRPASGQTYDAARGRVTAQIHRLGVYALVTSAPYGNWFPLLELATTE